MAVVIIAEKRIRSFFCAKSQEREREREREREGGELLHEVKHPLRNVKHMGDLQM